VAISSGSSEITGLVTQAVEGSVKAYGELYTIFVDRIYRYVYYQVGERMMAEDITEEVFVKGLKAIRTCRGREQTFSAWLYRIARNQVVDTLRRNHGCLSFEAACEGTIPVDGDSPEQQVEDSLEWQRVLEAVSILPGPQKQVILLKFLDGADNAEISRVLGKREGAIRALQMRALSSLRQKLNGGGDSHGR
jgi:RNA polymerase sigma-70 factor (ECF subfamily)